MNRSKPAKNHPWAQWRPGLLSKKPSTAPLSTEPFPKRILRKAGSIR